MRFTPCWQKRLSYTESQIYLTLSITGCAQPHEEFCRFAAAAGAILTADFIGREYVFWMVQIVHSDNGTSSRILRY